MSAMSSQMTLALRSKPPTMENQPPFPLMNLPAELRIQIYQEFFDSAYIKPRKSSPAHVRRLLPLLQSNCTIRREAARLFYRDNFKRQDNKNHARDNPILTTSDFISIRKIPIFFRCSEPDLVKRVQALVSQIKIHGNPEQDMAFCFRPSAPRQPTSLEFVKELLKTLEPHTVQGSSSVDGMAVWHNFLRRRNGYQSWSLDLNVEDFRIEHVYDSDPDTGETEYEIFCLSGPVAKLDWEGLLWRLESVEL